MGETWHCARFLLVLVLVVGGEGGRILMYLPVATRSHMTAWTPLAGALSDAGHQVTYVTGYHAPELPPAVNQLVVDNFLFRNFQDTFVMSVMKEEATLWSLLAGIGEGWQAILHTHRSALKHPQFQQILQEASNGWDLVIASPFLNEAGVMLANHFKAPMILYLPANAGSFLSLSLGHPDSVAWSGAMAGSLIGRINTLFGHMAYELVVKPYYFVQPQYAELKRHIPNYTTMSYSDLERNADFAFYFSSPHLGSMAPRLPNTANTAFIQCRPGENLDPDLESWLASSNDTVVYFSFGSAVQPELLTPATLTMFEKVFARLHLRVIWKRSGVSTERMLMREWVDQQDVLAHPKVNIFISQVGLMSLQEAIYHEVAILGIPLLYEQKMNAELIKKHNLGVVVDFSELNEQNFSDALVRLQRSQRTIQKSVTSLAHRVKDSRTTPLQDAVWWCEYVIRHKGGNQLQSDYRHLSLVQFYSLDILLLLLLQLLLLLGLLYLSLRQLLSMVPLGRSIMVLGGIYLIALRFVHCLL